MTYLYARHIQLHECMVFPTSVRSDLSTFASNKLAGKRCFELAAFIRNSSRRAFQWADLVVRRIFLKKNESCTELAWEQRKLGEFTQKVTRKNSDRTISETFTNSAEHGVISQRDFFDHDITNETNIGGYYVVSPDDFVYNPRISTTAPVGPIRRNRLGRPGVMSPLYTVFNTDESIEDAYLEHYFKTNRWHPFMFLEGNSGARSDRFSISDSMFFEMPISCPSLVEQQKIAMVLEQLDNLITLHQCEQNTPYPYEISTEKEAA